MPKNDDLNRIAKIEQLITLKYGKSALVDVRANWSESKEKKYLKQIKELYKKEMKSEERKVELHGFSINEKLLNKDECKRTCPICRYYSFKIKDDVYMNKFGCCYKCYVQFIEGREERWNKGWRPNV